MAEPRADRGHSLAQIGWRPLTAPDRAAACGIGVPQCGKSTVGVRDQAEHISRRSALATECVGSGIFVSGYSMQLGKRFLSVCPHARLGKPFVQGM